jgi:hypothetical protein
MHAVKQEVKQEAAPGPAMGVKVEVKQEAAPKVKVELKDEVAPEVRVEVKDEPLSPPRGQLPTSHALKRARTEATPPPPPLSPPLLEPWRTTFAFPPMYRRPSNSEWAGYNTSVHLWAAEAGIIIIDNDEDADGGASTDAKGKAPL